MKTVYLLLTRSHTVFSRLIRLLTGASYTHISLSLDPAASAGFYSFGRKNPYLPFPAGFVREDSAGGFLRRFPHTRCSLLALDIPDEAYREISVRLGKMEACAGIYRYNLLGALLCGLGLRREKRRHYFCSQFAGDLLSVSGAVCLPKPAVLMQPADYAALEKVRTVYTGTVGELLCCYAPSPVIKMPGILAIPPEL